MFGAAQRRVGEKIIRVLLFLAALVSILITVGIVFSLVGETLAFFQSDAVRLSQFLTGSEWSPLFSDPEFGIRPLVQGTLIISGIGMLVAVPLGLGTAVYLSEYASPRVRAARQADARAARRRPDGRLRLLRAHVLHAEDPQRRPAPRRRPSSTGSPAASSSAS